MKPRKIRDVVQADEPYERVTVGPYCGGTVALVAYDADDYAQVVLTVEQSRQLRKALKRAEREIEAGS